MIKVEEIFNQQWQIYRRQIIENFDSGVMEYLLAGQDHLQHVFKKRNMLG
jgi:hypothetical protein